MPVLSTQELYDKFITEVQDQADALTDTEEGSILDTLAGVTASAVNECSQLVLDEVKKTFFKSANGPEVTQGADDLQDLAVDHFGDDFARPEASNSIGIVTFSRPTSAAGAIAIPAGTIVKTRPDANGEVQRFETLLAVTMTGLTVNASIEALEAGEASNVDPDEIVEIESTLLDSTITVTNADETTGGEEEQDDATYRETIRNLITARRGASLAAIEAKAKTVSGVVTATGVETVKTVIEYDRATDSTVGEPFDIVFPSLYISDANGEANDALLAAVKTALNGTRAAGVNVNVFAATALPVDWTATITLNPAGPNFSALSADPQLIIDSMTEYLNTLPIGDDFIRADAEDAILAIWGPAGTDDLTDISTSVPSGNVSVTSAQKVVAGTVELV